MKNLILGPFGSKNPDKIFSRKSSFITFKVRRHLNFMQKNQKVSMNGSGEKLLTNLQKVFQKTLLFVGTINLHELILVQFSISAPPWKCQKTFNFLTFSGGREMEDWAKMGWNKLKYIYKTSQNKLQNLTANVTEPAEGGVQYKKLVLKASQSSIKKETETFPCFPMSFAKF